MKNLCTICMREGSKGIPNKNLRELNGQPLMAYTIQQALQSELFNNVVISTDSEKIAETAKSFGAEVWFIRPNKLATDEAQKLATIRHAFQESEKYFGHKFDVLVDLDVTSPLRTIEDITKAYNQFVNEDADILITACPAKKNPYYNMVELKNGRVQLVKKLDKIPNSRQGAPQVFDMNASIYIWSRDFLIKEDSLFSGKLGFYEMPEDRSIDIDSPLDWEIVKMIMEKNCNG